MSWGAAGAVALALAVGAGAFGAHGLRGRLDPAALAWWATAAQYHFYHGLGLLLVGLYGARAPRAVGPLLVAGLVLFSGSLYAMALTDARWLGAVTPIGGTAWIVAWIWLAVGLLRARPAG